MIAPSPRHCPLLYLYSILVVDDTKAPPWSHLKSGKRRVMMRRRPRYVTRQLRNLNANNSFPPLATLNARFYYSLRSSADEANVFVVYDGGGGEREREGKGDPLFSSIYLGFGYRARASFFFCPRFLLRMSGFFPLLSPFFKQGTRRHLLLLTKLLLKYNL